MKFTYNISHDALIGLIIHFSENQKYNYGAPVHDVVKMLNENILGSEYDVLLKLVEEFAAARYFSISNGNIYT